MALTKPIVIITNVGGLGASVRIIFTICVDNPIADVTCDADGRAHWQITVFILFSWLYDPIVVKIISSCAFLFVFEFRGLLETSLPTIGKPVC